MYLKLPNYVNSWREEGFEDADLADGGSDRLVDELVVWGDATAIADRVREHLEAGADHVCLQPVARDLAGALADLAGSRRASSRPEPRLLGPRARASAGTVRRDAPRRSRRRRHGRNR